MPLIIISGLPSSGKTTRSLELKKFFEGKDKKVTIVSENTAIPKGGFQKNEYFADSQKEKMIRSDLKSEALRNLNKDDVIILDAGNYIKGYRYELYCATKSARCTQLTLFCGIQIDKAWKFNQNRTETEQNLQLNGADNSDVAYTREIFDALCMRYEEPHANCRWDSPLFVTFPEDEMKLEQMYDALFSSKPPPPNMSTQNPPLNATNYLFELDKKTQEIISDLLSARKVGVLGAVPVKGSDVPIDVPSNYNAVQLNRLRRQFLNYNKLHSSGSSLEKAPQLFVQFLNSNCK